MFTIKIFCLILIFLSNSLADTFSWVFVVWILSNCSHLYIYLPISILGCPIVTWCIINDSLVQRRWPSLSGVINKTTKRSSTPTPLITATRAISNAFSSRKLSECALCTRDVLFHEKGKDVQGSCDFPRLATLNFLSLRRKLTRV